MKYSAAVAVAAILSALALSACDKPTVVTPAPPVAVPVPGPAGPAGPQGATGATGTGATGMTGAPGAKGETGDNIIIVDPNSVPKR
ncbi:MAG: hypothetical protein JJE30_01710 [Desulfuromonadales bacterium]|nr:hypothetical protein [Desulfuromonadales bacterium]